MWVARGAAGLVVGVLLGGVLTPRPPTLREIPCRPRTDLRDPAVESFVVRTAVNSGASLRLVGLGALLLLLVEVGVGANRSSYTRAVAGSNPAAPTTVTRRFAWPKIIRSGS